MEAFLSQAAPQTLHPSQPHSPTQPQPQPLDSHVELRSAIFHKVFFPADNFYACFEGTRVPKRVVTKYNVSNFYDNMPQLQASGLSWLETPAEAELETSSARGTCFVYYGDAEARVFIEKHFSPQVLQAYDSLRPGAFKKDIFCLCEILVHGGLFVDIKCARLVDYRALIGPLGTWVLEPVRELGDTRGLNNGFFAAPPGAEWVAWALCVVLEHVLEKSYGVAPLDVTGPMCLGRGVRHWLGKSHQDFSCKFLRQDISVASSLNIRQLELNYDLFIRDPFLRDLKLVSFHKPPPFEALRVAENPETNYTFAYETRQVYW